MPDHNHAQGDAQGDAQVASKIAIASCAHGTVFIQLFDRDGKMFAVAPLELQLAADVLKSFTTACHEALAAVQAGAGAPLLSGGIH